MPEQSQNTEYKKILDVLRSDVDRIDQEVLELVAERMQIAIEIGELKKEYNITSIRDNNREDDMMQARRAMAEALHLDLAVVEEIFSLLIAHSRRVQEMVVEGDIEDEMIENIDDMPDIPLGK